MNNERYKLWQFFRDEFDSTLTDGELDDVVYEVELYLNKKLRDYFAAKAKDDFDDLEYDLKELIVGRKFPDLLLKQKEDPNIPFDFDVHVPTMEHVQWIAEGRAKWKFIQADAMLKQREI